MKSRPVLIGNIVFTVLNVLTAGAALQDVLGDTTFALIVLGVTAAQAGFNVYAQSIVVPQEDVAAFVNSDGNLVAGNAGGPSNGTAVDVVPVGTTGPPAVDGPF